MGFAQSAGTAGCAQTGPVLPWQDCPGARWINQAETIVQVGLVRGPGCVAGELPAANQTCLITNERRTVWLMFEVQPLPGGPTYRGAPAGQLRFSIVPADAEGHTSPDDGTDLIGMTDFDFALFDVTSTGSKTEACNAIRAASAVGSQGTVQVACNYSGLPGPTGLARQGQAYAADDQRYCKPLSVQVGQVFLLAVDNYSLNATYFKLKFNQADAAATAPQAWVTPQPNAQMLARPLVTFHKACGLGAEVCYSQPVAIDSVSPAAFTVFAAGQAHRPVAVQCQNADALRGTGTRFLLLFNQKLDTGLVQFGQTATVANRYSQGFTPFTQLRQLRAAVAILPSSTRLCIGQPFQAKLLLPSGFGYGGWRATAGFAPGVGGAEAYVLLQGALPTSGRHKVTFFYTWPEGCADSASTLIDVVPTPAAPQLLVGPQGTLYANLEPGNSAEWALRDSLFTGPAEIVAPAAGSYRVRQVGNGCPSGWSQAQVLGVTDVRHTWGITTTLYPNPAHDVLNLRLAGAGSGKVSIEIFAADGKAVLQRNFAHADWEHQIGLEGLKPGVYTVWVSTQTSVTTHRITKQ